MPVQVLDFKAEWCGPCKQQEPILKELEDEYDDVDFSYIDIEEDMDTANKYHVQSVPTLVFLDGDGEVQQQLTGLQTKDTVSDAIDNLQ